MKKYLFGFIGIMVGVNCLALDVQKSPANGSVASGQISSEDMAVIETFFEEFRVACNEKDVEKVKKMVGRNWDYWSCNIQNGIKFERIEIFDIVTDGVTNVVTKVSAVDKHGRRSSPKIVFTVNKCDGGYSIEKIAVPEVDKRIQEFDAAVKTKEMLVEAINDRNIDAVKSVLSFEDAKNFEAELLSRGLMWIKCAIVNGVKVPLEESGVGREGNDLLVGRVYVPCSSGGTNVLERFYFKDGKIDRAAPRKLGRAERLTLINERRAAERKQWEDQEAAERKKVEEKILERARLMKQ